MQMTSGILLGLAILAFAFTRVRNKTRPVQPQRLKWWQKLVHVIAVILAILVVLNPEFLALGILGDTAFFDLLVLLLSLQLQTLGAQVWGCVTGMFSGFMRWWTPRLSYLSVISAFAAVGTVVSTLQKVVQRLSS